MPQLLVGEIGGGLGPPYLGNADLGGASPLPYKSHPRLRDYTIRKGNNPN